MSPERTGPSLSTWLRPRLIIVGSALLVGIIVGAVGMVGGSVLTTDIGAAESTTFALGALVFGFGLLGWSGSIFAGTGIENMQRYMGTGSDWSERDSRRAMARVGGFGAGVMIGVSVVAAGLRSLLIL